MNVAERLAALSDERAIGPLRTLGKVGGKQDELKHWRRESLRHGQLRCDRCGRYLARQVAIATVIIERCQLVLFTGLLRLCHMLVTVVAKM